MRLPASLLALALFVGCDAAAPDAPPADPFGPPGTWATVATLDAGLVVSLTIDRADGVPVLYVAGGRGGAYRLDVSGPGEAPQALWAAVGDGLPAYTGPGHGVTRVLPVGPDLLLGTTVGVDQPDGTRAGLFRSSDGGATWARSDAGIGGPSTVSALATAGGVVLARSGGLFRSTDGGRTWAPVGPERVDVDADETVVFRPGVPDEAWSTTRSRDGLDALVSVDGGRTWAAPALAVPDVPFAVGGFGWDGGGALWFTANAGVVQNRTAVEGGRVVGTAGRVLPRPSVDWCPATAPHPTRADVALAACGPHVVLAEGDGTYVLEDTNGEPLTALLYDPMADALYVGVGRSVLRLSAPFAAPRRPLS